MKIGIVGCGWLGFRLATFLHSRYEIFVTTTSFEKKNQLGNQNWKIFIANFDNFTTKWEILEHLDCIIITIPFGKRTEIEILSKKLKNLSKFIQNYKNQLFFTSSTGIYLSSEGIISETISAHFLQKNLHLVEKTLQEKFPQINILRLGGLMGDNRKLSNYQISEPNHVVNHVHYQDVMNIIERMITKKLHSKIYNVVAPLHPVKQAVIDFQKEQKLIENPYEGLGKIISSKKICDELSYEFQFPNPIYF